MLVSSTVVETISLTMSAWLASSRVVDIVGGSVFRSVSSCFKILGYTRLTQYSYVFFSIERSVWMIALTGIVVVCVDIVEVTS